MTRCRFAKISHEDKNVDDDYVDDENVDDDYVEDENVDDDSVDDKVGYLVDAQGRLHRSRSCQYAKTFKTIITHPS